MPPRVLQKINKTKKFLLIISALNLSAIAQAQENNQREIFLIQDFSPLNFLPEIHTVPPTLRVHVTRLATLKTENLKPPPPCPKNELTGLKALQNANKRGLRDEAWFLSGIVYDLCGEFDQAKTAYTTSLKLRRNNPNLLFLAGLLEFKLGNPDQGKIMIEEAAWLGLKDQYLVKYLLGVHAASKGSNEAALKQFESTLLIKPNFLPALMESFDLLKEMRSKANSEKEIAMLDNQIASRLSSITRLNPHKRQFAVEYVRYLLVTGDPVNSPSKLGEGEVIADTWLKRSESKDDEMFLFKVQILEKRGKKREALALIIERQESGIPLSPTLDVIKNKLTENFNQAN